MEKVIMIPEWRYNKMLESYDKALEELQQLRAQIQEAGTGSKIVELLKSREEVAEAQALKDIFEYYVSVPSLSSREYPEPLKMV